jgi:hypothetical protein
MRKKSLVIGLGFIEMALACLDFGIYTTKAFHDANLLFSFSGNERVKHNLMDASSWCIISTRNISTSSQGSCDYAQMGEAYHLQPTGSCLYIVMTGGLTMLLLARR